MNALSLRRLIAIMGSSLLLAAAMDCRRGAAHPTRPPLDAGASRNTSADWRSIRTASGLQFAVPLPAPDIVDETHSGCPRQWDPGADTIPEDPSAHGALRVYAAPVDSIRFAHAGLGIGPGVLGLTTTWDAFATLAHWRGFYEDNGSWWIMARAPGKATLVHGSGWRALIGDALVGASDTAGHYVGLADQYVLLARIDRPGTCALLLTYIGAAPDDPVAWSPGTLRRILATIRRN